VNGEPDRLARARPDFEELREAGEAATLHATCIALGGRAALLRGPPGAGKSDLALRCLSQVAMPVPLTCQMSDGPGPVRLVSDDQVMVQRQGDRLLARAPAAIRGKIEVRGVGIVHVPTVEEATVACVFDLVCETAIERFPLDERREVLCGIAVPVLAVRPFEASAALKVLLAISTCNVTRLP